MKVYFSTCIKRVSGYLDGIVFYCYPEMHGVFYARNYFYPSLTSHHHYYGACFKAIINNLWKAASPGFKQDLRDYTIAWNETQYLQKNNMHHYNAVNILIKACFKIARQKEFDLRTLNVSNFTGSANALLGNQQPTVANLIKIAKLPECGFQLENLDNLL